MASETTSNDSDNELEKASLECDTDTIDIVTISFHKQNSYVTATVNHSSKVQYKVDYLDLKETEYKLFKNTIKTNFSQENEALRIDSKNVILDNVNHTVSIQRIIERQPAPIQNDKIDILEAASNTERIQFSTKKPLMAKYKNGLYYVDKKLENYYSVLLRCTNHKRGTPIRISNDRINIYHQHGRYHQNLSFRSINSYDSNEIVVIKVPESYENHLQQNIHQSAANSEYSRYIIVNYRKDKFVVHKVDPILIHSSKYDVCTEIYAELDSSKSTDLDSVVWSNSENEDDSSSSDDDEYNPTNVVKVKTFQVSSSVQQSNKSRSKFDTPIESERSDESGTEDDSIEDGDGRLKMIGLRSYQVPSAITSVERTTKPSKELLQSLMIENFEKSRLLMRTNAVDYVNGSKNMIYFQEAAESIFLERFTQTNVTLTQYMDNVFYFPIDETMLELSAAIDENYVDWLILKLPSKNSKIPKEFNGEIHQKGDQKIYIKIFKNSMDRMRNILPMTKEKIFSIHFIVNRTPFQMQHFALDFFKKQNLFDLLIKNPKYDQQSVTDSNGKQIVKLQNVGKLTANLNSEQREAVRNILNGGNYPLPYVIYGPPGTGKTRTLTAAIEQIILTTDKNILVCTMSNAACDEITERLLNALDEDQIYRMYAVSYNSVRLKPHIESISNYENHQFFYPSLKTLYKYRVLICTLVTAGCLTRARRSRNFKTDHFSYVFIDECSSAYETMTLIPIAGLCTEVNKVHANIVLAGDPKQLNAVTKSDWAAKLGYKISLLEHLCDFNLYKRNAATGKFNEIFITQLVKNYRSHPSILKIPNELFYDNVLQSKALTSVTDWYLNSKILQSKKFPMIFKSVQGVCKKDCDFSLYNDNEVDAVIKYIQMLLKNNSKQIGPSDIGVATPYRKQCKKIVQKCLRYRFDGVTVGTAEVFQGQEKPVMIVSTVRSDGKHLGFVNDPRRMNVIITRAKCLLIIIGDPHTLKLDSNWKRLLEYCLQNNSFIQGAKPFSI